MSFTKNKNLPFDSGSRWCLCKCRAMKLCPCLSSFHLIFYLSVEPYPQTGAMHQMADNTGEQPRIHCPRCSYTCTSRAYLLRHVRVHTGERPYRCDFCPSAFKDRSNLNRHRRCHTGERPFKCPHCWRCFNQSSSLRTHVLGQHGTPLRLHP